MEWIDITKERPKISCDVLIVTVNTETGERQTYAASYRKENNEFERYKNFTERDRCYNYSYQDILSWMPFPYPYEE